MSLELNRVVPSLKLHGGACFAAHGGSDRVELSFAEMHRHVSATARLLVERGVRPGAHVGLYARNSLEWIIADLACLAVGAVTVPFDRGERWGEPEQIIEGWELELLVTDAWPAQDKLMAMVATRSGTPGAVRSHAYRPNDVSTVKFSSGSSARPRAIKATVRHFDHMARHLGAMFPTGPGDLFLVLAPLTTWLQRFMVHLSVLTGTSVVIARPEMALSALQNERPTLVIGVPRLLEAVCIVHRQRQGLGAHAALSDLWGGRLRYLWTGSAPIDRAVLDAHLKSGIPVFEGYGMSETGMIAKNCPSHHRAGSVGRIFPGRRVDLGPDGQIMVQSEFHANTHYWRGEGNAFRPGGWVATGDVGRLDEDGYLYIDGRVTDMIVLGNGRKIFPEALEQELRGCPAIADCAALGHDGCLIVAVQTTDPDLPDSEVAAALAEFSRRGPAYRQVADFVRLRSISFEEGFRTANGKLKRAALTAHCARLLSQRHD